MQVRLHGRGSLWPERWVGFRQAETGTACQQRGEQEPRRGRGAQVISRGWQGGKQPCPAGASGCEGEELDAQAKACPQGPVFSVIRHLDFGGGTREPWISLSRDVSWWDRFRGKDDLLPGGLEGEKMEAEGTMEDCYNDPDGWP